MSPFTEDGSWEIRKRDNWCCTSCGKSSFESDMWLLEAAHVDHTKDDNYLNTENGETKCRSCHLLEHIDAGDIGGVEGIANRIWNSGLRHYSIYQKNFNKLLEDRIYLTELLTATGFTGRIQIHDRVGNAREMLHYINSRRRH